MKYSALLLFPLVLCCATNHGTKSSTDDTEWTPQGFKNEYPDEWVVVNSAIDIQQREGSVDFAEIDKLVSDYLEKEDISLPIGNFLRIYDVNWNYCREF